MSSTPAAEIIRQDEIPSLKAKFEGTPTRYTPPRCEDEQPHEFQDWNPQRCAHAKGYHVPDGVDLDASLRHFGMRRRKDGSAWFVTSSTSKRASKIPDRTQEAVAACRAMKLHYWSGAPHQGCVWAIDDGQRPHLVRIDHKNKTARMACDRIERGTQQWHQPCSYARGRISYQSPGDTDATLELLTDLPDRS
jgi:hypothetical protein